MLEYKYGEKVELLIRESGIEKTKKDILLTSGKVTFKELLDVLALCDGESRNIMHYMAELTPLIGVHEERPPIPKSEEYKKLMKRLRMQDEEKKYRRYLSRNESTLPTSVDSIGKYVFIPESERVHSSSAASMAKEVKHQLTTILNVFITCVSSGYAMWYWSGSSLGLASDYAIRMLLSLVVAIIVLIAEVVVFGGYVRKVDEARERERASVERKTVVETVVIKSGESKRQRPKEKPAQNGKRESKTKTKTTTKINTKINTKTKPE
ncbi:hypothetical protein JL09_g2414 [Pichia kudriavzevii]|uniref:Vacuolar ATPase assembly integral membrane protein VPH2 n=1 Tax=Pichia kudriavzevii TaxID=4909 RepID=A0A099P0I5_PICKU|nr:hypothetical protein JL09_g2414 [Pichia kudriavzevii]